MRNLSNMSIKREWLTVGKLVAPQGLKGEIRVHPSSDFPERFLVAGKRWLQKNKEEPYPIELIYGKKIPGKSIYIVSFKNINNRDSAESLIGKKLLVPSSHRPKMNKNEYHFLDLLGLDVKLINSEKKIGEIIDLTTAGNDLLEVKLLNSKKVLIPLVKEIVTDISIKEGSITINPPPGLLEI